MRKIEMSETAFEALGHLIYQNPCKSGCCIPENQNKKINCDECQFTKGKYELQEIVDEICENQKQKQKRKKKK